ncbi:MAG: hypothetical protein JHC55_01165 [Mycolicibacterium sp.]|nr:hypothetical protein [Mycolicibacterium sp.]
MADMELDRSKVWIDNLGRRWEWSYVNGWCVDGWAMFGGRQPSDDLTFTVETRRDPDGAPGWITATAQAEFDAITGEARRVRDAEVAREDAIAREALAARLRQQFKLALTGHRGIVHGPGKNAIADHLYKTAADVAVDVFLEVLRNPPTMVHHHDGETTVRWPDEDKQRDA